jgi:dipeptidyl aminopeptidase/acylaminoacyl peptidase
MKTLHALAALALFIPGASAVEPYQHPPEAIQAVLDATPPPTPIVSPDGKTMLLCDRLTYPPISDLAAPMLRLAGVRIDPRIGGAHGARYFVGLSVESVGAGKTKRIELREGAHVGTPLWNAKGTLAAFTDTTDDGVELWVLDAPTAKAWRVGDVHLNTVLASDLAWMADQTTLIFKAIPRDRPAPPADIAVPAGPRIESSVKAASASSTYESRDLLKTPHDADLFEYYATARVMTASTEPGAVARALGASSVIAGVTPSPDGSTLLVERLERPYSLLRPYWRFPTAIELWDPNGKVLETIASLPIAESVPIHGERTGPREHAWVPTEPATLAWVEALDGGDTFAKVPFHDRVMVQSVGSQAREIAKLASRYGGMQWLDRPGQVLLTESDEDKHWEKTTLVDDGGGAAPRTIWSRSSDDRYGDPGSPIERPLPNGRSAVLTHDGSIYLDGQGASADGNRPFVDRMSLADLTTERLFRSGKDSLESYYGVLDPAAGSFLTIHQSPADPPNLFLRKLGRATKSHEAGEAARVSTSKPLTTFADPTPQLRKISKQLVTYSRADGLPLSFTLYLPPDYVKGTRLPTVMWAYPLDFTDPSAAGQVNGSTKEFTTIRGPSPLFLALAGYAVLDNTAMPVVGPAETVYDTFIEQIVANAKAAIDKAVEMGVTDRDRVGVMGHSHGALMTANLLAWSDLFRAGVARSGAYNHTLRPFGFQNERRTLYEAPETYEKLSPLIHADKIDEPLLLIHGEIDVNPGTVPLQSEKLFEAIRGAGGTTRLVMLPFESHGYAAKESTEHVLWEMLAWMDRYVKEAPPRVASTAAGE